MIWSNLSPVSRTMPWIAAARLRMAAGAVVLALASVGPGQPLQAAAPPRVTLDIGTTVECHDVTPPEFAKAHPQEKIVEAKFHVSALLTSGRAGDLEELHIILESREGRMRVLDFLPHTELASDVAGNVDVSTTNDRNQVLSASLGTVLASQVGSVHVTSSPGPSFGTSHAHGTKESYKRLADKQLVLASGTVNAEHGVFFKWRRSSQVSLEGLREVSCRFVVPRDWRGDWLQARAEMLAVRHDFLGTKVEPCDQVTTMIGLYLVGDSVARQAARELALAQASTAPGAESAGAQRQVCNKPVAPAKPCSMSDWFKLSPLFKPTSSPAPAADATGAPGSNPGVTMALGSLRELSGK